MFQEQSGDAEQAVVLLSGCRRESGLRQLVDRSSPVTPREGTSRPVDREVSSPVQHEPFVVAEGGLSFREHSPRLRVVPVDLNAAREFVAAHHRHHEPPVGHKFSVGVAFGDLLVGVAIVGRPVSRVIQAEARTLEVIRSATDGTRNANSMLYGAARRVAFALGYDRLITYTQDGETGASLRAAGYRVIAQRPPRRGWDTPSRPRENRANYVARTLWDTTNHENRSE